MLQINVYGDYIYFMQIYCYFSKDCSNYQEYKKINKEILMKNKIFFKYFTRKFDFKLLYNVFIFINYPNIELKDK